MVQWLVIQQPRRGDSFDNPIAVGSRMTGKSSIPVAEALVLRDSLVYVKANEHTRLEVEVDSKLVIDVVNEVFDPPWRLIKIV
ncbi:hypothetical protein ACLB2K_045336 [Fragaria x ananassa]